MTRKPAAAPAPPSTQMHQLQLHRLRLRRHPRRRELFRGTPHRLQLQRLANLPLPLHRHEMRCCRRLRIRHQARTRVLAMRQCQRREPSVASTRATVRRKPFLGRAWC